MQKKLVVLFVIFVLVDLILFSYYLFSVNNVGKIIHDIRATPTPTPFIIPDNKVYFNTKTPYLKTGRDTPQGKIIEVVGNVLDLDIPKREITIGKDSIEKGMVVKIVPGAEIRSATIAGDLFVFQKGNLEQIIPKTSRVLIECNDTYCGETAKVIILL